MTRGARRRIAGSLFVSLCAVAAGPLHAQPDASGDAAIRSLAEQFSTSIRTKDVERFNATLYDPKLTWIGVLGDTSWAKAQAAKPGAAREFAGDSQGFIHWVAANADPIEERFGALRIDRDDAVATVRFPYGFYVKGEMTNSGLETWSLVRTSAGWKIAAIVYSVNNSK